MSRRLRDELDSDIDTKKEKRCFFFGKFSFFCKNNSRKVGSLSRSGDLIESAYTRVKIIHACGRKLADTIDKKRQSRFVFVKEAFFYV